MLFGAKRDVARGMKAVQAGCLGGSARACEIAGEAWLGGLAGGKDASKALRFFAKGCDGGDYTACTNAGFMYTGGGGSGVARDDVKAIEYGRRACFGGEGTACGNIGYKVELGEGIASSPPLASALYERACKLSSGDCFRAGFLFAIGATGVPKDDAKAKSLLERSCKAGSGIETIACVVGGSLYGAAGKPNRTGLEHTVATMKPQCDLKEGRACAFLGIAEFGLGQRSEAQRSLKQACSFRDPLGCELAKRLR